MKKEKVNITTVINIKEITILFINQRTTIIENKKN